MLDCVNLFTALDTRELHSTGYGVPCISAKCDHKVRRVTS